YWQLARFDRPIGWLLLLWPTMWGLWAAAGGTPPAALVALFAVGALSARAMSCCVNDIADRDIDRQVGRTKERPLARGAVTVYEAALLATVFALGCFGVWLLLGWPARLLCLFGLFVALSYPLAKRWMQLPQLHLAAANSMGVLVAYAELRSDVPPAGWLLYGACFAWSFAFDTIYAMVDREDDRKAGVNSAAVWLGDQELKGISLAYILMLTLLVMYGAAAGAAATFYIVAVGGGAVVARWLLRMIRGREPERCFYSFRMNHWLGLVVLAGVAAGHAAW
nr:4-hydroxybenzoate octaprenyltransferase [Betaproteobacteria bacterium AqS2]